MAAVAALVALKLTTLPAAGEKPASTLPSAAVDQFVPNPATMELQLLDASPVQ